MRAKQLFMLVVAGSMVVMFLALAFFIEGPVPNDDPRPSDAAKEEDVDDTEQVIIDFELPHISPEGRKDWVVRGTKARRSKDGKTVDIEDPVITVWSFGKAEKGSPAAEPNRMSIVTAARGLLNHEEESAYLSGGVTIEVTDMKGKEEGWIETEDLNWESKGQLATTEKRVRIRRSGISIRGIGMRGDVKGGHFEVLNEVEMVLDAAEEAAGQKNNGA